MRASLSLPDSLGGGGGGVVVVGGGGGAVVVVISVVVVTGATVVNTSAGASVNPVIMSSATSSFTVVVTTEARVVTTGAVVVSTLGASVVAVSVSMGGAQEIPATSSRGACQVQQLDKVENMELLDFLKLEFVSSPKKSSYLFCFLFLLLGFARLHSARRVSGSKKEIRETDF